MQHPKVTIVGAGNVGGACAHWLAKRNICDIVLIDIPEAGDMPRGKALDLMQCGSIEGFDISITGTTDYSDTANSDIVVITAGIPRKPGMSRDDLLKTNAGIVTSVSDNVKETSPNAIIIVVSNPLDAMVYAAWKASGFEPSRVMGQAGILDVARFKTFLAMELQANVTEIDALLLGGHGDSMVPLPRLATVNGTPVTELIAPERLAAIVQRTRDGGAEIVKLLQKGSAFEAPGAASAQMVEAILLDQKKELPCAAYCSGQYGVDGLFVGVPAVLGKNGVEEVVEIELMDEEKVELRKSVEGVRELVEKID